MKRIFSLFLVLVMMATFMACSNASKDDLSKTDAGNENASAIGAVSDSEDVYTVKIVGAGDADAAACEKVSELASKITMEKFGCKVEVVRFGLADYLKQINLMISSGEKLDLFFDGGMGISSSVNSGQIMALDELLNEYGQDILADIPEDEWAAATVNGKKYGVISKKDKAAGGGIAIKTAILEELNYDVSSIKSISDLTDLFAAIKKAHPDTYPLASDRGSTSTQNQISYDGIANSFAVLLNPSEITSADELQCLYMTQEYNDNAALLYSWSQAGYISPDSSTSTENNSDILNAGKSYVTFTNIKPGIEGEWERKVPEDMTIISLNDPIKTASTLFMKWYIPWQCEKPEYAMQVLNEMYTNQELSDILCSGIEGENYVKDSATGLLTFPEGVDGTTTTYSMTGFIWPNECITTPWMQDGADIWNEIKSFNASAKSSVALGFSFDNTNVFNEITACKNVEATYANIISCGEVDPSVAIPKFIDDLKAAGLDKIIAEAKAQLGAFLDANNQ